MARILLLCVLSSAFVEAQVDLKPQPWHRWSNVAALPPGTEVKVKTAGPAGVWKGTLARVEDRSLLLVLAGGTQKEIGIAQVRQVSRVRKAVTYAPLIGAVAGALVMTLLASRQGSDFTGAGVAGFAGIGAGIGAAGGMGVRAFAGSALVFRAP
jgi:hypothetical protein